MELKTLITQKNKKNKGEMQIPEQQSCKKWPLKSEEMKKMGKILGFQTETLDLKTMKEEEDRVGE